MAKSLTPKFSLDPISNPLPNPNTPDPVEENVQSIDYSRLSLSPFKGEDDENFSPPKDQEVCILAFPVATYKAISDEATKRGMTLAQAVQEAFNLWFRS